MDAAGTPEDPRRDGPGNVGRWLLWGRRPGRSGREHPFLGRTAAIAFWVALLLASVAMVPGLDRVGQWAWTPDAPPAESCPPDSEATSPALAEDPEGERPSLGTDELAALGPELEAAREPVETPPTLRLVLGPEDRCRELGCDAAADRRPADPDRLLEGVPDIEDPRGAMKPFLASLKALEEGGRRDPVRVIHYGDSLIVGDWVTGTVRQRMQERFGNAGPGFILPARPWPWYMHDGVRLSGSDGTMARVTGPVTRDGAYGLGGVSTTFGGGATVSFGVGDTVGRADVHYLAQRGGGTFQVTVGGTVLKTVETGAGEPGPGFVAVDFPPGKGRVSLRVVSGPVRLFGVAFERAGAGVTYDSLGINGGRVSLLLREDADHWARTLEHRSPDLVILNFGTNESMFDGLKAETYKKGLRAVVRRVRKALPRASCLLVAPMDRAVTGRDGLETAATVPMLVVSQREVALEEGCAFYNTFRAMGGMSSFGRWMRARPKLAGGDHAHPTAAGAQLLGRMLYRAIERAYERQAAPRSPARQTASSTAKDGEK